jgi:hypothetical protein
MSKSLFLGRFGISEIKRNPNLARQLAQILMAYRDNTNQFQVQVSTDVPFLKFTSERGPQGDRYENWFWLDPDRVEPGEIKGTIFIETNDPDFPKLSVPVTGTVLQK